MFNNKNLIMFIECEKESLPGVFPEFIGINHMNKGLPM